jgi:hypothetical protein
MQLAMNIYNCTYCTAQTSVTVDVQATYSYSPFAQAKPFKAYTFT